MSDVPENRSAGVALNERAMESLEFIRTTMARSAPFTAVSGRAQPPTSENSPSRLYEKWSEERLKCEFDRFTEHETGRIEPFGQSAGLRSRSL